MSQNIIETQADNWKNDVIDSDKLIVVKLWHPQCPHCRTLEPVYAELSKEYAGKLKFVKFNILENPDNQELAAKYGIMGTPTLKFFCGGRPVQDVVGALPNDYLRQAIEFAIKKHRECAERSIPLKLSYIS